MTKKTPTRTARPDRLAKMGRTGVQLNQTQLGQAQGGFNFVARVDKSSPT
jgi:hypothetical protein